MFCTNTQAHTPRENETMETARKKDRVTFVNLCLCAHIVYHKKDRHNTVRALCDAFGLCRIHTYTQRDKTEMH